MGGCLGAARAAAPPAPAAAPASSRPPPPPPPPSCPQLLTRTAARAAAEQAQASASRAAACAGAAAAQPSLVRAGAGRGGGPSAGAGRVPRGAKLKSDTQFCVQRCMQPRRSLYLFACPPVCSLDRVHLLRLPASRGGGLTLWAQYCACLMPHLLPSAIANLSAASTAWTWCRCPSTWWSGCTATPFSCAS